MTERVLGARVGWAAWQPGQVLRWRRLAPSSGATKTCLAMTILTGGLVLAMTAPPARAQGNALAPSAAASAADPAPAKAQAAPTADCATISDAAIEIDLRAALAQSQKAEAKEHAALLDESIQSWRTAVEVCQGRAKERAERNLLDNRRLRASLNELLGTGEACATSARNARSLQDLARQAIGERRWADAAALFRKSEGQWELGAERCAGSQQQLALQTRAQVALDGYNAEHCAPMFDRARSFAQSHRNAAAALSAAERQTQQQIGETLWRDAAEGCKGAPMDIARSNAQNFARDRGTAWARIYPPEAPLPQPLASTAPSLPAAGREATQPRAAAAGAALQGSPAAAAAVQTRAPASAVRAAVPGAVSGAVTGAVSGATSTLQAAGSAAQPANVAGAAAPTSPVAPSAPQELSLVLADGATLTGWLTLSADGQTHDGQGRITWPNGENYTGTLVAGKRHGQGEFRWANGQAYRGEWTHDKADGNGKLSFANGNVYEGQVRDGQPQGRGRLRTAGGDVYSGQLQQGQPHGPGVYEWANGQRLEGNWANGQASGPAQLRFANGNAYVGELLDSQPHGTGEMVFASGDRYQGGFRLGEVHGSGSYRWKDGQSFVGPWVDGKAHGKGLLTFANGNVFEGEVQDGKPHGAGRLRYASGDVYEGQFAAGLADGDGRYVWQDGSHYSGRWRSGRKEGAGRIEWPNGDRWEGEFLADVQTERGVLTRKQP